MIENFRQSIFLLAAFIFLTAKVSAANSEIQRASPGAAGNTLTSDSLKVSNLPVHVFRAAREQKNQPLVVIISGDGGWNSFIDGLAHTYSRDGFDVAGIDALKYFWHKSNPTDASQDFSAVIRYFAMKWQKRHVILLGYSFGADILPFVFNDFSQSVRKMIPLMVMMSPSHHASFEFQITGWLKGDANSPYHVVPEIEKITWCPKDHYLRKKRA